MIYYTKAIDYDGPGKIKLDRVPPGMNGRLDPIAFLDLLIDEVT